MQRKKALSMLCFLALAAAPAVAKGPGVIKFGEATFEVAESAGQAAITVERSGGEDSAVSVQYATSDGTATAGQDYTSASGTLSWAAGDGLAKTFTIPVANDGVAEGTETVHLTLSAPTGGATLDPVRGTADLRIGDSGGDDHGGGGGGGGSSSGAIKFDQSDFQVLENGGQAVITVERSHGESGPATVQFATSDGTATAGRTTPPPPAPSPGRSATRVPRSSGCPSSTTPWPRGPRRSGSPSPLPPGPRWIRSARPPCSTSWRGAHRRRQRRRGEPQQPRHGPVRRAELPEDRGGRRRPRLRHHLTIHPRSRRDLAARPARE